MTFKNVSSIPLILTNWLINVNVYMYTALGKVQGFALLRKKSIHVKMAVWLLLSLNSATIADI